MVVVVTTAVYTPSENSPTAVQVQRPPAIVIASQTTGFVSDGDTIETVPPLTARSPGSAPEKVSTWRVPDGVVAACIVTASTVGVAPEREKVPPAPPLPWCTLTSIGPSGTVEGRAIDQVPSGWTVVVRRSDVEFEYPGNGVAGAT